MTTFGPFALGRAVASYGAAEVVRAKRWRGDRFDETVHLARTAQPKAEQRMVAAAEALAQTRHDRVARVLEVGAVGARVYAVADVVEGLDLWRIAEHQRTRASEPDVALAAAVALSLARIAADLADRDVWAGARGAGLSSLFPAGLRLEAVVVADDGVRVRPLAGAVDDPAQPTPFRAPEIGARNAPASAASDVFLVAQVLRALGTGDASAHGAPRPGPLASALAPILAGGLTPNDGERLGLPEVIAGLEGALERHAGADAHAILARALRGELAALAAPGPPDDEPSADDARAAARAAAPRVLWPGERGQGPRGPGSVPAFLRDPSAPDHDAVARVFTDEGGAAPDDLVAVGRRVEVVDERTERLARPPARAGDSTTTPSDPPWVSSAEVEAVEETERAPASPAPPRVATLAEGGLTTEALSPFDDERTE